jgi:parallel beta-helix repeat protein
MMRSSSVGLGLALSLAGAFALVGCGDDDDGATPTPDASVPDAALPEFGVHDCAEFSAAAHCVEVHGGDAQGLLVAANSLEDGTTIVLGRGTFAMTDGVFIRNKSIHLVGQGIDQSTLDFGATTTQVNGVDVIGDDFLVQDLTVKDSPKDGIRVEATNGIVFRRIRSTWSTPGASTNGSYGIYPVKSQNVLVEDSRAENASDAGLYVGQCQHVIVRRNTVSGNVAGLEIENTQYADVYENTATDNTGGIVVFDLPGNPVIGRDIRIRNNTIHDNNHPNFSPGGTVQDIPVGTGTFALASRRVEITGNDYADNDTGDIALLSGLAIEQDTTKWTIAKANVVGEFEDLNLPAGVPADTVMNYRSENIVVAGNTHSGSGTKPDLTDPLMMGLLLGAGFGDDPIAPVLYDTIEESMFDSTDPTKNSNDHHICAGASTGDFASLDLAAQNVTMIVPFFRPAAPYAPFDCTELTGGPVAEVVLP